MHKRWKEILIALVLGLIYPAALFSLRPVNDVQQKPTATQTETTPAATMKPEPFALSVLQADGTITDMDIDTYLTAVLLCEMPAEFESDALKAQAVVARTYALRRYETGTKHTGAAVCTDPSCCQGYRSAETYLSEGGSGELLEKVHSAVQATTEQVLTYNGELIEATYFSCSGGSTEDAAAVWGSDIPYLQATESPGEEGADHFVDTVSFDLSEFKRILDITANGTDGWIENVVYTDGGGVDTIRICGVDYKGTTLRQKLGLRSTAFVITVLGDNVTITTKGYGHRVGMSQYGAEAMAVQGSSYEEILAHYYKGTELVTYSG